MYSYRKNWTNEQGRATALLRLRHLRGRTVTASEDLGPCFGRRVGLDDPQRSLPTPTILWFCDHGDPLKGAPPPQHQHPALEAIGQPKRSQPCWALLKATINAGYSITIPANRAQSPPPPFAPNAAASPPASSLQNRRRFSLLRPADRQCARKAQFAGCLARDINFPAVLPCAPFNVLMGHPKVGRERE